MTFPVATGFCEKNALPGGVLLPPGPPWTPGLRPEGPGESNLPPGALNLRVLAPRAGGPGSRGSGGAGGPPVGPPGGAPFFRRNRYQLRVYVCIRMEQMGLFD